MADSAPTPKNKLRLHIPMLLHIKVRVKFCKAYNTCFLAYRVIKNIAGYNQNGQLKGLSAAKRFAFRDMSALRKGEKLPSYRTSLLSIR